MFDEWSSVREVGICKEAVAPITSMSVCHICQPRGLAEAQGEHRLAMFDGDWFREQPNKYALAFGTGRDCRSGSQSRGMASM